MGIRYLLLICCSACTFSALKAQQIDRFVDANSVLGVVQNSGLFFNEPFVYMPGYRMNAGNANSPSLMWSAAFWYGGLDELGQLRVAADRFGNSGYDFSPGPYSSNGSYTDLNYINKFWNSIWTVSKEQIVYHIDNFDHPSYQMPAAILKWPANGDAALGVANDLAPYVDVDGDGIYNPHNGDYPCIRGDKASYVILNDDFYPHGSSGGGKIGMEIHMMFYQFQSDNYIDSTTFIHLRIINRGNHSFSNFKTALFCDFDLGGGEDDYMGTKVDKNMLYVYNSDNLDLDVGVTWGFQENPPAFGVVSLNKNIISSAVHVVTSGGIGFPPLNPWTDISFWRYMNGLFPNNQPFYLGANGIPPNFDDPYPTTPFYYTGNPLTGEGWSEVSVNNVTSDRRGSMTMESIQFLPGTSHEFEFAFILNRQGNHLENVVGLFDYADSVQTFYNNYLNNFDCQQQGTGVQDDFAAPFDWTPWMVEVKRLDGRGNMGFALDLTPTSMGEALWNNVSEIPTYRANKAPIYVKIENPGAHALGRFELMFRDYGTTNTVIDTASWTIYRYHHQSGALLDSVNSESTIIIGDLQYIPEWGISVQVKQKNYFFPLNTLPIVNNWSTTPIEVSSHFGTQVQGWLTGVEDTDAQHPQNWALSGEQFLVESSPFCFSSKAKDLQGNWANLLNGTVTHFALTRSCGPAAPIAPNTNLNIQQAQDRAVIAQTPSVDLVFTHEKDKWTRCVVVEMCDDPTISQGNAQKMKPRNRPSVDKNGYSAGHSDYNAAEGDLISPVGMGWFPGFAVDVETGQRLNVVFGENSFLVNQNGADMLWNPTSQMYDQAGNPRFGGQHLVFVIGENINNSGMPIYDSCATFFDNISSTNNNLNRDAWQSATWTMYPVLREGHTLLEEPVLIRMRVNKRYENLEITGVNEGKPAFEWNISSLLPANLSIDEALVPDAIIYPNPAQNQFFVQWSNMQAQVVRVFSTSGVLVHEQSVSAGEQIVQINTESLASGMYIVQVGEVIRRVVVE